MLPLNLAERDVPLTIKKIGGNEEIRNHLQEMGFIPGNEVSVVNELNGNVIVNVLDARVGISKELAAKIMV